MKIGSVKTDNFTVLAPLAGITNLPLRLLAKRAGCGLVCSEMISANGLVYGSGKTVQLLESIPEEKPLSVQIFGSDPPIMAEAARIVQDSGADIVDINFGCSVKKILKGNSGSALMKEPPLARRILDSVRKAVTIPLTIKIRSGWEPSGKQAVEIARLAEDCGVDAIAVHPRTATQGFRGEADWSIIAAVIDALTIPVIGNGDVTTPADALRMINETGCDGVMVGRAAIGNPRIFGEILAAAQGQPSTASERCAAHRHDDGLPAGFSALFGGRNGLPNDAQPVVLVRERHAKRRAVPQCHPVYRFRKGGHGPDPAIRRVICIRSDGTKF